MNAANNIDRGNNNTDDGNAHITHAAAASVTTSGLSFVSTSTSVPDLSDDELVALQLKDKKENSNFVPSLKFPKGKVNKTTLKNI